MSSIATAISSISQKKIVVQLRPWNLLVWEYPLTKFRVLFYFKLWATYPLRLFLISQNNTYSYLGKCLILSSHLQILLFILSGLSELINFYYPLIEI